MPSRTPQTYHDVRSFLHRVAAEAGLEVLRAYVSAWELDDVVSVLPPAVRELFTA